MGLQETRDVSGVSGQPDVDKRFVYGDLNKGRVGGNCRTPVGVTPACIEE